MTAQPDPDEFQAKIRRLELLVRQAEQSPDPVARANTRAILEALLDLHGTGLGRLLDHVAEAGEPGAAILDACCADEVVGGLLLLHGLHPRDVEDRARQALERVRPFLESHGCAVELLGLDDGVVRVRIHGRCDCATSTAAIRQAVEDALTALAPDAAGLEIEGLGATTDEAGRVPLPVL